MSAKLAGVSVTSEGKETVFTMPDGSEFRIAAVSGAAAVKAFEAWLGSK